MPGYHVHLNDEGRWVRGQCNAKTVESCPFYTQARSEHFDKPGPAISYMEAMIENDTDWTHSVTRTVRVIPKTSEVFTRSSIEEMLMRVRPKEWDTENPFNIPEEHPLYGCGKPEVEVAYAINEMMTTDLEPTEEEVISLLVDYHYNIQKRKDSPESGDTQEDQIQKARNAVLRAFRYNSNIYHEHTLDAEENKLISGSAYLKIIQDVEKGDMDYVDYNVSTMIHVYSRYLFDIKVSSALGNVDALLQQNRVRKLNFPTLEERERRYREKEPQAHLLFNPTRLSVGQIAEGEAKRGLLYKRQLEATSNEEYALRHNSGSFISHVDGTQERFRSIALHYLDNKRSIEEIEKQAQELNQFFYDHAQLYHESYNLPRHEVSDRKLLDELSLMDEKLREGENLVIEWCVAKAVEEGKRLENEKILKNY